VTITRQRFANEENGFAVLDAELDGDTIVLVGPLIHLEPHERARIIGSWISDSRYGDQVKVAEAHPLPPGDLRAVSQYLQRVKHVGRGRAEKLIARHGAGEVMNAIDNDPVRAFRLIGLSDHRAAEAASSWHELRVTRQLHMLLAPHGLAYLVKRLSDEYGPTAHRVVTQNPYELTRVYGVGFRVADRIARAGGVPPAQIPGRARAAIVHTLSESEGRTGSTCMALGQLLANANELLGGVGEPASEALVEELVTSGDLVREQDWIYRRATAALEAELADRVLAMVSGSGRLKEVSAAGAGPLASTSESSDPSDDDDSQDAGATEAQAALAEARSLLTEEQTAAVAAAFTYRLSVITGGPGTGKTSTLKAIAGLAEQQQARVMLMAPTGRAATRMTESSGFRATTVHSALQWVPGAGPEHDEDDPLSVDLLILDESSMANLELMVSLLRAVPSRAHVVLVGDADQLAPVGAGKPFAELVESDVVPTTRLNHIFRQAAGSMIVQGAHAIRRGEAPDFTPREEMRRDLFMIERGNAHDALAEIVELVSERLPRHYGVDPVSDIQVFAPVYKGDLGIDALNAALREKLNPLGTPVRGGSLRIGDKLMMTGRNLHELRLMNGTVLRLLDEVGGDGDDAALLVGGDDDLFRLPPEEAGRLRLAYACSVHRGQGIELPIAVIVAHQASGAFFLRREMLYTAVTRASLATVIVGSRDVVARAARTPDTGSRVTRLGERLLESVG
jgi:exodeoxyribonuclease V alpha subunit